MVTLMQERLAVDCEECLKGLFSLDSALRYDCCGVTFLMQPPGTRFVHNLSCSGQREGSSSQLENQICTRQGFYGGG